MDNNESEETEVRNDMMSKNEKQTKKNVAIICLAFVCVFTSSNAVNNLQSSINVDGEVGLYSLAFLSAGSMFASLLLTTPLIFIFGYKWTIVAGQVGMLAYIAANMYPIGALLYPISLLVGMFRVTMWTAQSAYFTDLSTDGNNNDGSDAKLNRYFGIFFCTYQTAQIWGNLVTYFVLRDPNQSSKNDTTACGANYLASEQMLDDDDSRVSPTTTYILYGVFIAIILVSIVFVIIFLDQRRKSKGDHAKDLLRTSLEYTLSTLKHFKDPKHLLLAPLAFWSTASETFIFGTFTESFITCILDIQYIGLVMAAYGITASIFSIIMGYIGKLTHSRIFCMLLSSLLSYTIFVVMLEWHPSANQAYVLYILACISGLTTAIIKPFTTALYGSVFVETKESSFSIYSFIQNAGGLIVFLTSSRLRVRISIILQIVYLTIATICYLIIEFRQRGTSKITSTPMTLNNLVITIKKETAVPKY